MIRTLLFGKIAYTDLSLTFQVIALVVCLVLYSLIDSIGEFVA